MKRIKIAIIIMAAVIVAAVGIYFIADYFNNKSIKEAEEEEQKLVMFEFNSEDANKVEINNDGGDFTAEYISGEGWRLTNNDEFVVNESVFSSICTNLASLKATKILEDKDISKYGLDDPVKVTVYTKDDSSYTVLVGDATPTYENFYAMKENDDNIYLISFITGSVLCASKDDLKYRYSYPYSSYEVEHFALWKGSETDENILFSMNKDSNDVWSMDKPYNNDTVYNTQIDTFLTRTSKDEINSFVQENCAESDYSKYGFDDPQYVFEISTEDDYTKIIFGDLTNNDTEIYGLYSETGQVVTFLSNGVTTLGYTTTDMLNTAIFSADISKVSNVEISMPNKKASLDIISSSESYKLNEKEIGEDGKDLFISFFDSFNNAYYKAKQNDEATPSGDAEITVTYTLTSNVVTEISYIPIPDSDNYWVNKDGNYTGYTVDKSVISNINSAYEKLENTMK